MNGIEEGVEGKEVVVENGRYRGAEGVVGVIGKFILKLSCDNS